MKPIARFRQGSNGPARRRVRRSFSEIGSFMRRRVILERIQESMRNKHSTCPAKLQRSRKLQRKPWIFTATLKMTISVVRGFILSYVSRESLCLFLAIFFCGKTATFTLVLDPGGTGGRIVGESFERGITLELVRTIKMIIEQNAPSIRVVIARAPGEAVEQLSVAQYANRLETDFYFALAVYEEQMLPHRLTFFYLVRDPFADFVRKPTAELTFVPLPEMHRPWLQKSKKYGQDFVASVKNSRFTELFSLSVG